MLSIHSGIPLTRTMAAAAALKSHVFTHFISAAGGASCSVLCVAASVSSRCAPRAGSAGGSRVTGHLVVLGVFACSCFDFLETSSSAAREWDC